MRPVRGVVGLTAAHWGPSGHHLGPRPLQTEIQYLVFGTPCQLDRGQNFRWVLFCRRNGPWGVAMLRSEGVHSARWGARCLYRMDPFLPGDGGMCMPGKRGVGIIYGEGGGMGRAIGGMPTGKGIIDGMSQWMTYQNLRAEQVEL